MRPSTAMGTRIFRLFGTDIEIKQEAAIEENRTRIKRPRLRPPTYQALPDEYRDFIASRGADVEGSNGPTLVFSRTLTDTDMRKHHARLLMPRKQMKHDFLTAGEEVLIHQKHLAGTGRRMRCTRIPVTVVDPALGLHHMSVVRWNDNEGQKKSWWYALIDNWTKLADDNKLSQGDAIQVWSFRFKAGGGLGFVIHRVQPPVHPPQTSNNNNNRTTSRKRRRE